MARGEIVVTVGVGELGRTEVVEGESRGEVVVLVGGERLDCMAKVMGEDAVGRLVGGVRLGRDGM